ncbi:hypothetical protein [Flyfo podovirus Tbat2_2]|nr:hypothetical protein [Flyfo podovirus Tbat2_2]
MTEYEINKAVAEKLGVRCGIMGIVGDGQRLFVIDRKGVHYRFDPCNNEQQASWIIEENNIQIRDVAGEYLIFTHDKHKLVRNLFSGAMLLFLEI